MFIALIICFILFLLLYFFDLPKMWSEADKIKKFDPHCVTPGLADIYFQDFVNINARRGIKINLVRIESTNWGIIYHYTEEKLNATK